MIRPPGLVTLAGLATLVAVGCTRPDPIHECTVHRCGLLDNATPVSPKDAGSHPVIGLNEPDKIWGVHGYACADSTEEKPQVLQLHGSAPMPLWVTQATVVLNGWRLGIQNGDDIRPAGVGTVITNVHFTNGELTWDALGAIGDEYFSTKYTWCYTYTAIGWNGAAISAEPYEPNAPLCVDLVDNAPSIVVRRSTIEEPSFATKHGVAAVPRGFTFVRDRAELYRIAYNLDHAERLGWPPGATPPGSNVTVGRHLLSWESKVIFQDDNPMGPPAMCVGDAVSAVVGDAVEVVQPPFTIRPGEGASFFVGCVTAPPGKPVPRHFVIDGLPFAYAVPMLTGWSLDYDCRDDWVADVGAWVDDFRYDKPFNGPGTLAIDASSILRNRTDQYGFSDRERFSVLGLNLVVGPPDLVPFPDKPNFCTRDAQGRLRLFVLNKGGSTAGLSTVTVTFNVPGGPYVVQVGVDSVAPNAVREAVVPVKLPDVCLVPTHRVQCDFTIEVDSAHAIAEAFESNNVANGYCVNF